MKQVYQEVGGRVRLKVSVETDPRFDKLGERNAYDVVNEIFDYLRRKYSGESIPPLRVLLHLTNKYQDIRMTNENLAVIESQLERIHREKMEKEMK